MLRAEEALSDNDLRRVVELLVTKDVDAMLATLATCETPAAIHEIAARLLRDTPSKDLDSVISTWPNHRPSALSNLPTTRYTPAVKSLVGFMDEVAAVIAQLDRPFNSSQGLVGILDWYVDGGYFDMEYACARAAGHLRRLPDYALGTALLAYLDDLRERVKHFLDQADGRLAHLIRENWADFLSHPRLSTRVLWDLVKQRRLKPQIGSCLWVVVFDGMRWDTWQRLVKPRVLERFELHGPEKAYLSLLPSWTFIARAGLLAGHPPMNWKSPKGYFTTNQKQLAARLFEISDREVDDRLQFYSVMEADRTYRRLDRNTPYPWNVLIFNISDDNLHQERGDLESLNGKIEALLAGLCT